MKLLVTGGAGYVGSVCTAHLLAAGHDVTVLDDLSTGHRDAVPTAAAFVEGDVATAADDVLNGQGFDGVLHFAARSLVGESVVDPAKYWHGNVVTSVALLDAVRAHRVPRLVFSSTAATYGEPEISPITEDSPTRPTNPYGATKLAIDHAITSYAAASGGELGAVSLRYFNVAGAHRPTDGPMLGERHTTETHLIPLVLQVALGEREHVSMFGDDWPTPDGTCLRDYIHVDDLAAAHLLALDAAGADGGHLVCNLGNGTGFSVREVVEACRRVTGHPIPAIVAPRRAGDPAVLVASAERARTRLGWAPERGDLDGIVADAWAFAQAMRVGAGA
ncbi:UDP-glucose 4-epimerase GalE [Actinomycetospora endophytica]|uniref:UDP-glucose 4-epimerase n=1 Tax=Actinomycetospora endophytica TaxID=2291215 RepID=A0ABS8PGC2_9PSEU|nr:UDP-glucose 4-epimerase GalE [Actinomycetospora endophytica]MCD2197311.1 UDP-glucose 4-epimerase GalE [Actinomycetospora endophytica]